MTTGKRGKRSKSQAKSSVVSANVVNTNIVNAHPRSPAPARPWDVVYPARKVTPELCRQLVELLVTDLSHNFTSAACYVGLHHWTVKQTLERWERQENISEIDAECGAILFAGRAEHSRLLRERADTAGLGGNGPGVASARWRCEIHDPKDHPRKADIEVTGKDGAPLLGDGLRGAIEAMRARKAVAKGDE